MRFSDLGLCPPLLRALEELGYETPTPIQQQAIPVLMEGRDLLGVAQTGTGKSAAFCLPMLHHMQDLARTPGKRPIRALILTPTRELAGQLEQSVRDYGKHLKLRSKVIYGGVGQGPQVTALRKGVDVLIATPGRLLDLHNQGHLKLDQVEHLVLDEADRMLDMGFIHDIKKILALLPAERQNLLFSATMPDSIARLARDFLHEPVRVEVAPQSTTVERIEQQVMFVAKDNKRKLLAHLLTTMEDMDRCIVFTRTKHGANRVVKHLDRDGISAAAIHGNKSQGARTRALEGFRDGSVRVLVATDIASRGIDVEGISHVINFDLPNISESYVHRIGRTARAGRDGIAISFCDDSEGGYLRDIERLTGVPLAPVMEHPFHDHALIPSPRAKSKPEPKSQGRRRRGGGGRSGGRGRSPSSSSGKPSSGAPRRRRSRR
ncbi:MAG: DEAD/DEAH box helicase [Myxococcota bacterium]|nr:DEAD/DEAH box helicase [Myxococcota bacterium]